MTAAHAFDASNVTPAVKAAPKHRAVKPAKALKVVPEVKAETSRFQSVKASFGAPARKVRSHRDAKALRAGIEAVQAPAPLKVVSQPETFTYRAATAVDAKGEATPIYATLARTIGTTAHSVSEDVAETTRTNWLTELFETEEQRKARLNVQAVAGVIQVIGSAALYIAKRAGK